MSVRWEVACTSNWLDISTGKSVGRFEHFYPMRSRERAFELAAELRKKLGKKDGKTVRVVKISRKDTR